MSLFDTYIIVDWSASNVPKRGKDSIWICCYSPRGERVENPPTRHAARELLASMLVDAVDKGERVVAGFDFPFGYPSGFAARLGLNGVPWLATWDEIARLIDDRVDNHNNRFEVGAEFNRRVSGASFPFWGCPASAAGEFLGPRHHRGHTTDEPLKERRLIDDWMVGAQPCWKLAYAGSVGSQVLTGIPVVRALRDDPRWVGVARIWPFETGLGLPDDARIVFAEVWPSWWKACAKLGPPNDRAQVRTVARIFAAADCAGELASWFTPPISDADAKQVLAEEAWTLGVMTPRVWASRGPTAPSPHPSPHKWGETKNRAEDVGGREAMTYTYLRDPAAIYERSFALIEQEADLSRFPPELHSLALRLAHAAGDISILGDLLWSENAVPEGRRALALGAPILVDSRMVAAGITGGRRPGKSDIICTLNDPKTIELAETLKTTRSAAAVELWRPHLAGAVVAIGNAPTALFHLLEMIASDAPKPALVLGFPVGFVGAAEAKEALAKFGGLDFIALQGRRGGSALAAAAVNALARPEP